MVPFPWIKAPLEAIKDDKGKVKPNALEDDLDWVRHELEILRFGPHHLGS